MKRIISIVLILIMSLSLVPCVLAEEEPLREYGIYTRAQIADVKARLANGDPATVAAFEQFITRVDDWCMERTSHATESYSIPGFYSNEDGHITASKNLTHDAYAAYATGLAWQLTGEDKYAEKARELLNGWATVNKTFSHKDDTPLVAAYGGVALIYGAELITEYAGWTQEEQTTFKTWVDTLYRPAIEYITGKHSNNWASWAVLAGFAQYHYLDDAEGINRMASRLAALINSQINSKGEMPLEIERGTNGMWYTYFSLAPLTQAAQVAYNLTGNNYFYYSGASGGSLTKALDYYLPFVEDPTLWDAQYQEKHYKGQSLNLPNLANGNESYKNWPTNMYKAMGYLYGEYGTEYASLVEDVDPVMGGWTDRDAHHIAWSFPSLIPPTAIITEVEEDTTIIPEYITDDFEGYDKETGDIKGSVWHADYYDLNGSRSGLSASVVPDPADVTNYAFKLEDKMKGSWNSSAGVGTGCVELRGDMEPKEGLCYVTFDLKLGGSSSGSSNSGVHIQDYVDGSYSLISLLFKDGKFMLRRPKTLGGSTSDLTILSSVSMNTWYNFKFIINTQTKTFDTYINNNSVATGTFFRGALADQVSRIKFTTDSGSNNTVNYIDNVYANTLAYEIESASVTDSVIEAMVLQGGQEADLYGAAYDEKNRLLSICKLTPENEELATLTKATGSFEGDISTAVVFKVFAFEKGSINDLCINLICQK